LLIFSLLSCTIRLWFLRNYFYWLLFMGGQI